jgi:CRISPR system Cascade subunit CasE
MTYVSRLLLNPRNAAVQRDLANCQKLHCTILTAFPRSEGAGARKHFKVLYRVESDSGIAGIPVLVQSECWPDWHELPPTYLADVNGASENPAWKSLDAVYDQLQVGQTLRFRLRANPTRKICTKTGPDDKKRNGKRVPLRTDEQRLSWLQRKGASGGFELIQVRSSLIVPNTRVAPESRSRGTRSATGTLTFASVLFEGELRITDPGRFRQTLENGIGAAKAYGFGLLSVAPARSVTQPI